MRLNISFKILLVLFTISAQAQLPETDIYLAKINQGSFGTTFTDMQNITHRKGYDNQPFFTPDGRELLYVAIYDTTQSDIYAYSLQDKNTRKVTNTKESEYSPTVVDMGKKQMYTVVRVDADSGQRLYNLDMNDPSIAELIPHTDSIGYYCRMNDSLIAMFILGKPNTIEILNVNTGKRLPLSNNIGRCIRYSPSKKILYYVIKETEKDWYIHSYNLRSKRIEKIIKTPEGSEDFALMPDGKIIIGKGAKLLELDKDHWTTIADFSEYVQGFYRIAVNREGTLLALVAFSGQKP